MRVLAAFICHIKNKFNNSCICSDFDEVWEACKRFSNVVNWKKKLNEINARLFLLSKSRRCNVTVNYDSNRTPLIIETKQTFKIVVYIHGQSSSCPWLWKKTTMAICLHRVIASHEFVEWIKCTRVFMTDAYLVAYIDNTKSIKFVCIFEIIWRKQYEIVQSDPNEISNESNRPQQVQSRRRRPMRRPAPWSRSPEAPLSRPKVGQENHARRQKECSAVCQASSFRRRLATTTQTSRPSLQCMRQL